MCVLGVDQIGVGQTEHRVILRTSVRIGEIGSIPTVDRSTRTNIENCVMSVAVAV